MPIISPGRRKGKFWVQDFKMMKWKEWQPPACSTIGDRTGQLLGQKPRNHPVVEDSVSQLAVRLRVCRSQ